MNSSIENIVQSNIDASKNFVIALSGGVDSSVLAHILCKISKNISKGKRIEFDKNQSDNSVPFNPDGRNDKSTRLTIKRIKTNVVKVLNKFINENIWASI